MGGRSAPPWPAGATGTDGAARGEAGEARAAGSGYGKRTRRPSSLGAGGDRPEAEEPRVLVLLSLEQPGADADTSGESAQGAGAPQPLHAVLEACGIARYTWLSLTEQTKFERRAALGFPRHLVGCKCFCGCRRPKIPYWRYSCGQCSALVGLACCWNQSPRRCHMCLDFKPVDADAGASGAERL